jgi:hypothetical protein
VRERRIGATGAGVHGEAGGLVEHDQLIVQVKDRELAGLAADARVGGWRDLPAHRFAEAEGASGAGLLGVVDAHSTGFDPGLHLIAGHAGGGRDCPVEPRADEIARHLEPAARPSAVFAAHRCERNESIRSSTSPTLIALSARLKSGHR